MIPDGYRIEALRADHAPALAEAYTRNREHLAPFEPVRPEEFYDVPGQEAAVAAQIASVDRGLNVMWLLLHGAEVAGRVNLNTVVRGAAHSTSLGYWVAAAHQGNGLATAMVGFACEGARSLGLHRVEAGTLLDNTASQRVLEKSGFTQYGLAPSYLFIAGRWRDHLLFQKILHDDPL
ncbi:MAG: GNAT family N-acetyltransferase [Nocardioides sp.]